MAQTLLGIFIPCGPQNALELSDCPLCDFENSETSATVEFEIQGGHATARFLEGFLKGSLKEVPS